MSEESVWLFDPASIVFSILVIGVLIGTITYIIDTFDRDMKSLGFNTSRALPKDNAVIGYKVAGVNFENSENMFYGASGRVPYGVDSKANYMGFHAFKTIDEVKETFYMRNSHVLLEVLMYGEVAEYENGYIATKQRVLQVMPLNEQGMHHRCDSCVSASTSLITTEHEAKYSNVPLFYCTFCFSARYTRVYATQFIENMLPFQKKSQPKPKTVNLSEYYDAKFAKMFQNTKKPVNIVLSGETMQCTPPPKSDVS